MTITTASKNNAEAIKVIPKRHKLFITMPDEKRVVLTQREAKALYLELQQIEDLDAQLISDYFDQVLAAPEDEVLPYGEPALYAVSIFEKEHDGDDLQLLQAWLKDALFGWDDPYYRQVTFIKRIRRDAERTFAGLD